MGKHLSPLEGSSREFSGTRKKDKKGDKYTQRRLRSLPLACSKKRTSRSWLASLDSKEIRTVLSRAINVLSASRQAVDGEYSRCVSLGIGKALIKRRERETDRDDSLRWSVWTGRFAVCRESLPHVRLFYWLQWGGKGDKKGAASEDVPNESVDLKKVWVGLHVNSGFQTNLKLDLNLIRANSSYFDLKDSLMLLKERYSNGCLPLVLTLVHWKTSIWRSNYISKLSVTWTNESHLLWDNQKKRGHCAGSLKQARQKDLVQAVGKHLHDV